MTVLHTALRARARPLTGAPGDHDELLRLVGGARLVLLGESTHGTHELYRQRALITKRLRVSHYLGASLAHQFDAVVHIDRTRAVEPLERTLTWQRGEPPETYPTAL